MTSCPSRASRAAATELSTPPDIATTMRMAIPNSATPNSQSTPKGEFPRLPMQEVNFQLVFLSWRFWTLRVGSSLGIGSCGVVALSPPYQRAKLLHDRRKLRE